MNAIEKRARELLAVVLHEMYPDDAGKRYVIDKLLVDELDLVSARGAIRAIIAALTPPEVSDTTQRLIDLLIERDKVGRAKYGTTLDRTDLTRDQWLQHMVEELLDGAGYALAAKRLEVL